MTRRRWSAWAPDGRTVVPIDSGAIGSGYPPGWTKERIEKHRENGRKGARARWGKHKRKRKSTVAALLALLLAEWAAFVRWYGVGI